MNPELALSQISATSDSDGIAKVVQFLEQNPDFVETRLAAITPDVRQGSLLQQLRARDGGASQAEVALQLLDDLADNVRGSAQEALLVWQYVKNNRLWETHPDQHRQDEEGFMRGLNDRVGVKALFIVATSTHRECYAYVRKIDERWGPEWLALLKDNGLLPQTAMKDNISKNLLLEIAGNSKQGDRFPTAASIVAHYLERVRLRTNREERRKHKITGSWEGMLMAQDARALNKNVAGPENEGRNTLEALLLDEATPQQFYVQLGQQTDETVTPTKPARRQRRGGAERKRKAEDVPEDICADGAKRIAVTPDGNHELVRIRDHLLRRPFTGRQVSPNPEVTEPDQPDLGNADSDTDDVEVLFHSVVSNDGLLPRNSCKAQQEIQTMLKEIERCQADEESCTKCSALLSPVRYALLRAQSTLKSAHR